MDIHIFLVMRKCIFYSKLLGSLMIIIVYSFDLNSMSFNYKKRRGGGGVGVSLVYISCH